MSHKMYAIQRARVPDLAPTEPQHCVATTRQQTGAGQPRGPTVVPMCDITNGTSSRELWQAHAPPTFTPSPTHTTAPLSLPLRRCTDKTGVALFKGWSAWEAMREGEERVDSLVGVVLGPHPHEWANGFARARGATARRPCVVSCRVGVVGQSVSAVVGLLGRSTTHTSNITHIPRGRCFARGATA
jgi:hypothetical protein